MQTRSERYAAGMERIPKPCVFVNFRYGFRITSYIIQELCCLVKTYRRQMMGNFSVDDVVLAHGIILPFTDDDVV